MDKLSSKMEIKVDYVNFSVPSDVSFLLSNSNNENKAHELVIAYLGSWWEPIARGHVWQVNKAKGFYHTRYFDDNTKASLFVGETNRHVHCEFSGQTIDHIRAIGRDKEFFEKVATATSRVDFAVDFESECPVREFIVNNDRKAFKAGGEIFSEDGDTVYIGSWKGERFARVYRYHYPHPRHKNLRAEVVLRRDYAKQAMQILLAEGEVAAAIAAHAPFAWKHDLWKPDVATLSRIKSKRSDKERVNTIRWANGDVAAAIAAIHNDDLQDAREWFATYVEPRLLR